MNTAKVILWMVNYDVSWSLLTELLPALEIEEGSQFWNDLRAAAEEADLNF